MGRMSNLEVERTDAVDRPATGHRWMIVKSEAAAEVEKDYAGAARLVLEELAKDESLSVSKEAADALAALAALLEVEFTVKAADLAPEAEAVVEPEAADEAPDALEAAVEKALARVIERELGPAEPVVKAEQPKSQQPAGNEADAGEAKPVAKGEGMFANVIFGQ